MNENISTFVHRLNENDLREIERYAASKSTSVLVLFFTDMKGSSALKQRVTEVASEQVFHSRVKKEHDDIVGEVIRRDGNGAIIKDTGDGFFAVFDEPSTAVERALEIQAAFHGHPYIAVRIGMDMGQVIVQSLGGLHHDLFGRHVDWASRAMSLADGGHIIVTKAVATDAEGFINKARMRCKRHGFYIVKHGEGPIEVFEPYNANITQPMPLLPGEHVEDSISLGHSTAHAKTGLTQLTDAKSSSPSWLPFLKRIRQRRTIALGAGLALTVLLIIIAMTKLDFRTQRRVPSPSVNGSVQQLSQPASQQAANSPVTPSLTTDEVVSLEKQMAHYAAEIRKLPAAAAAHQPELKTLAEGLWSKPRVEPDAARPVALVYRLYSASILISPTGSRMTEVGNAVTWLRRSIDLRAGFTDSQELETAYRFFLNISITQPATVDMRQILENEFRIAMVEASQREVNTQVEKAYKVLKEMVEERSR